MARLGHRQPNRVSKVRKPTVVGPIAILPPIKTRLAVELSRREFQPQRLARPVLRKPTVVGPIAILPPIKARLAVELTRRELAPQVRVTSILRKPGATQAPVVPTGITAASDISATITPLRGVQQAVITATSSIGTSVATGGDPVPLQATILTTFATRRHSAHSRLLPPGKVDPAAATVPPVVTTLRVTCQAVNTAEQLRKTRVQKTLRPPVVVAVPSAVIPPEQLKIRTKIPIQPRRLPARVAWINPAVINPIALDLEAQVTPKIHLQSIQTRVDYRRRTVRNKRVLFQVPQSVIPAAFTSSSAVSATLGVLNRVVPSTFTATSTMSGSLVAIRTIVVGTVNASSTITANVSGGTTNAHVDNPAGNWTSFYYG